MNGRATNLVALFLPAFIPAASLACLLMLVAGLAWQVRQTTEARAAAESRLAQVRGLANQLVFGYHDRIANLAGALEARELLLSDAVKYLDGLAAAAPSDPALARELAEIVRAEREARAGDTRRT